MSEIDDEFIPCEICEEMIRFSDFHDHLRSCSRYDTVPVLISFHDTRSDDDIDYDEVDNLSIFARITRQNQLSPGTNLRNFMETHFRPLRSSQSTSSSSFRMGTPPNINDYEQNLHLAERIGKVEIGVKDVNKISKLYKKDKCKDCTENDDICPICRDQLDNKKNIRILLKCKHMYCDECIRHWMSKHKTCPVCIYEYE